jgi:hypothetical protein
MRLRHNARFAWKKVMGARLARDFLNKCEHYKNICADVRLMLSDAVLQERRIRVEVRPINTDAVCDSHAWPQAARHVNWDWEQIRRKLFTYGPRTLGLAFYAGYPGKPRLCGLAAAQVSPHARWLSLTHLESSPEPGHPLKGLVLPMAMLGLSLFKTQVSTEETAKRIGLRVLNPLPDALDCYCRSGYTGLVREKNLSYIVVQPPAEA